VGRAAQRYVKHFAVVTMLLCATVARARTTLTVAADGSGDFTSVQAAVDAAPAESAERVVIHIKPGTYKQRVHVGKDKPRLTLRGEDAKTTVLTYDMFASKIVPPATQGPGTSGSYSTLVEADDFVAENITFENSAGEVGQAVALRTTGRGLVFRNCRMLGWQDTLYIHHGSAHFVNCYIEGRVDFIFGRATAVFERCHVHSKNGGYVTAAATAKDDPFGFVFLDCKLTGDGAKAFLGRPWRDDAAVAFIRCEMGDHIRPEGWDNWRNPAREKTARFVEYTCTGPGADRSRRVAWSRELSDAEAEKYTAANVLAGRAARRPLRIVLVGDSTVTDKEGWGPGFKALLAEGVECVNAARGGRSSKSFRTEGLWDQVLSQKADYVLIQFGHNDEPGKGLERETDAGTEYRANMKRYVEEARAKGMRPILVTSLTRRQFGPDGKIRSTLTPYVESVKQVAAEMKVPLIDLHARSIELCESLGPEGCKSFSPPKGDGIDRTHLNQKGARLFGALMAEELRKAVPELAPYVKAAAAAAAQDGK
jgi:pectin methylesterase-like acyl-CoA thioesterase/lysophospholipase L1-like esterase